MPLSRFVYVFWKGREPPHEALEIGNGPDERAASAAATGGAQASFKARLAEGAARLKATKFAGLSSS